MTTPTRPPSPSLPPGSSRGRRLRQTFVALLLRGLGGLADFLLNLAVARLAGAGAFGAFSLATATAQLASALARLGFDNTLLKGVAALSQEGDWRGVKGLVNWGLGIALAASLGLAGLGWLVLPWLTGRLEASSLAALQMICWSIPALALLYLQAEMLKGLGRVAASQLIQGLLLPGLTLGLLVGWSGIPGAREISGLFVAGAWVTALVGQLVWWRATPRLRGVRGRYPLGQALAGSLTLVWIKGVRLAGPWLALLLLGLWAGAGETALFNAALRTVLAVSLLLVAVNTVAAPRLAALHHQQDRVALTGAVQEATRLLVILAVPVLAALVLLAEPVLMAFGQDFAPAATALRILALGQLVNLLCGPVSTLLLMSGQERLLGHIMTLTLVLSLLLHLLLVPRLGASGAAIGVAAAMILQNLLAVAVAWRRLGIFTPGLRLRPSLCPDKQP